LRPMLAYRHRQLADDLAAAPPRRREQRSGSGRRSPSPDRPDWSAGRWPRFLSTGGPPRHPAGPRGPREPRTSGDGDPADPDPELPRRPSTPSSIWAGASIAGRFTDSHRNAYPATVGLARPADSPKLAARGADGPAALISASAIGFLRIRPWRRDSHRGQRSRETGFLADVRRRVGGRDRAGRAGPGCGLVRVAHRHRAVPPWRPRLKLIASAVRRRTGLADSAMAGSGCPGSESTTWSMSITARLWDTALFRAG